MNDFQEPTTPETLQEQVEEQKEPKRKKFGTFGGVFTPTVLTILGVIMFLRIGWVMGNAGFLGGLSIVVIAFAITVFTALSMSSIVTNIRIGAGGAYAIVSQSLGLEIGGALGIPRYLSQALAVTMYIFGFREGWRWVFPGHPAIVVDLIAFVALYLIAWKSADLAIKTQYVIMAIIGGSLLSVAVAAATGSMVHPVEHVGLWGTYPGAPENDFAGTDYWHVFAVFFPAATGIMAGANMSGDLKTPRRSIPKGTMWAIGVSFVIYVLLAVWVVRSSTVEELVSNYYVMIDKAAWGPAVLAGLLGATFSSALASMVGSARILQAMGAHRVVPRARWLERLTPEGEPRNAMLVTGSLVLLSLMLRDLNAVAPLITMFFLLTYAMLNAVLLIEQSLDLVSFRPMLKVPRWVSLVGMIGSFLAMFIVSPTFGLVSVVITVIFYWVLVRRHLKAPFGDVRSGLFVALAEWAAKRVVELPSSTERSWKPNLLVPVEDPSEIRGAFEFLRSLTYPQGSVKIVGLATGGETERLRARLPELVGGFRHDGVFASSTVLDTDDYGAGLLTSVQALGGAFFRPNVVFLQLPEAGNREREDDVIGIIERARDHSLGVLLFAEHPKAHLGRRQRINCWVRDQSPDWELSMELGDLDLVLLIGHILARNWRAKMQIVTAIADPDHIDEGREFLTDLTRLARMAKVDVAAYPASFEEALARAPTADLNIFGLPAEPETARLRRVVQITRGACLFARDSGDENVLA